MKRVNPGFFAAIILFLLFGFAALDSQAQKRDEKTRSLLVVLERDARENGYKLSNERDKIFVQAINVIDPFTKKRLEGLGEVRIGCKEKEELQKLVDVLFESGVSRPFRSDCRPDKKRNLLIFVVAVVVKEPPK